MLKVAVIGVGYLGRHHARIYANMPGVELVGVCDSNAERGQEIAKEYKTSFYSDYKELLGKIDAASLAVPTVDHCSIGCELLSNKISVLIEKPIARTLNEADELISTAETNNVCLQIGHLERFNPGVAAISKVVTTPRFFETHRMSLFSPRSLDIDVVMDLMVHDLDIISWLVKSPVINISAVGIPVISPKFDIANARLEFANGCIANVTASRISSEKTRKLRLFQPGLYISLDYITQQAAICRLNPPKAGSGHPEIVAGLLPVVSDEPLRAELASFIEAVKAKQTPLVTGGDGRNALALALEVSKKIAEHAEKIGIVK